MLVKIAGVERSASIQSKIFKSGLNLGEPPRLRLCVQSETCFSLNGDYEHSKVGQMEWEGIDVA